MKPTPDTTVKQVRLEDLAVDFACSDENAPGSKFWNQVSETYRTYGCFIAKGFFSHGMMAPIHRDIQTLISLRSRHFGLKTTLPVDRFDDGFMELNRLDRRHGGVIYDACRRLTPVHELSVHPNLLELSRRLMGTQTVMSYTYKPVRIDHPNEDKYLFRWHQDFPYAQDSEDGVVYWIPLQDVDSTNGCLRVALASHRNGIYPVRVVDAENVNRNGARALELANPDLPRTFQELSLPMQLGDILVFSTLLLHCSQPNRSSRARWTLQLRHGNFEHPRAIEKNWPGGMVEGTMFHETYPESVV